MYSAWTESELAKIAETKTFKACQLKIKHFEIHHHLISPGASEKIQKDSKVEESM